MPVGRARLQPLRRRPLNRSALDTQDLRRDRNYDIFKAVVAGVLLLLTLALTAMRNQSTSAAAVPTTAPDVAPPTTIGGSDVTPEGCVTVTGGAPANSAIQIHADGVPLGTTTAAVDGTWTYTQCMSSGQYRLVAVTVDSAGTEVSRSVTFAVMVAPSPTESARPPTAKPTIVPTEAPSAGDGQTYTVQQGDWLMGLSRQFYGTSDRWVDIYEASNAKAAEDSSFNAIEDPNTLDPGWKIWIPLP